MYRALEIQEILLNIFDYFYGSPHTFTLPSLARTCRAFKEPALDLLWKELRNLSPLARCLPEASQRVSHTNLYSFRRPLTETELDILYSYTRRVRSIVYFCDGLKWNYINSLVEFPASKPLFPNLRMLCCSYTDETKALLDLPLPSLLFLKVEFDGPRSFQRSLQSFPNLSQNIKKLCISLDYLDGVATFRDIQPDYICRWQNLTSVLCRQVTLEAHELVHLSHMPALAELAFTASATLPSFDTPLSFPNLRDLLLQSELEPISRLLHQIRLPAIKHFRAFVHNSLTKQGLSLLWAGFKIATDGHTVEGLQVNQSNPSNSAPRLRVFDFEDLQPCMAFGNLRSLDIDIGWGIGLTERDLLTLVSAWPRLEKLLINTDWGWSVAGGLTPNGLLQLLQTCRSLKNVAVVIDSRGYTNTLGPQQPMGLAPSLPCPFCIRVLDSAIEQESVHPMAIFFAAIAQRTVLSLDAWGVVGSEDTLLHRVFKERWEDVCERVLDAIQQC